MLLILLFNMITPVLSSKIYNTIIKNLPFEYETGPSYPWLLTVVWLLWCTTMFLNFPEYTKYSPTPLILVGILGAFIGCILVLNFILIIGIPFEAINIMVNNILNNKMLWKDVNLVTVKYNELVGVTENFLFCIYSIEVGMLITSLYNMAMYFSNCHADQVKNIILYVY